MPSFVAPGIWRPQRADRNAGAEFIAPVGFQR